MRGTTEIPHDQYVDIEYRMWSLSRFESSLLKIGGAFCLPFVYPLVTLTKLSSETGFRTISELISIIPLAAGLVFRYEFYKRTFHACGNNVFINFGTVFYYPEIRLGTNIDFSVYCTIHHCDFGDNVLIGERCCFLSGSRYHTFARADIPMTRQGGKMKRIHIGNDVWIGSNSVIMDDVGSGSVVGAGSVVTRKVEPYSIVAGNPARLIGKRG